MARQFKENPSVLKELAEGENIVWKGAPEAFPLMTEDTKKGMTRRWLGCIIVAVALIAAYIALNAATDSGLSIWVLVIALVAVAYFAYVPVGDRGNVYKKCKYYITDRRVILDYAEREIFSIPLAGLKSEVVPAEPACIHVDLGTCVGLKGKKRRVAAFVPRKDDNENVCGFVIYNVADTKEIRAIF